MDLSKLTPAPWASVTSLGCAYYCLVNGKTSLGMIYKEEDCDFMELARNAFDVMMRRGWHAKLRSRDGRDDIGISGIQSRQSSNGLWGVSYTLSDLATFRRKVLTNDNDCRGYERLWPDPFTALVEADKWYRENVEK